jgi:hypothetical protein
VGLVKLHVFQPTCASAQDKWAITSIKIDILRKYAYNKSVNLKTGKTILVADISADMRELIVNKLKRRFDVNTLEAESGLASAATLWTSKVDLVIADPQIPDGAGPWLDHFMKTYLPATPLILFTDRKTRVSPGAVDSTRAVIPNLDFEALLSSAQRLGGLKER